MGIICKHSDYSLYDVLNGELTLPEDPMDPDAESTTYDFYGFHLVPTSREGGSYIVQYDGHAGEVGRIESDDYSDVLELVDDLMEYVFRAQNYRYQDDKEELVEWAGKIMTDKEKKVGERPDLYLKVPGHV